MSKKKLQDHVSEGLHHGLDPRLSNFGLGASPSNMLSKSMSRTSKHQYVLGLSESVDKFNIESNRIIVGNASQIHKSCN